MVPIIQKKILLVEDDVLIAMAEKKELESYDYRVKTANTGEKAIKLVREEDFDLILMDVNLGSAMDGTEVAQKILKTYDIPILFLSAYIDKEVVKKQKKSLHMAML